MGLSPRVRGNLCGQSGLRVPGRSIPACAGEPFSLARALQSQPVYPRVCGGTRAYSVMVRWVKGLSPRVRGNRKGRPGCGPGVRSIPACAGEPWVDTYESDDPRVYPRVCGGTQDRTWGPIGDDGLSPRVRGNLVQVPLPALVARSIPACAGEPGIEWKTFCHCPVYPRVCGGTPKVSLSPSHCSGLSPRVRGNRQPARL